MTKEQVRVELYLLARLERQMTRDARTHMPKNWRLLEQWGRVSEPVVADLGPALSEAAREESEEEERKNTKKKEKNNETF